MMSAQKGEEEGIADRSVRGSGPWYVRDAAGALTGPHPLPELRRQAEQAQLEPDSEVSRDREAWTAVHDLPELQMVWLVERPDGSFYGPLNLHAVKQLIHDGVFSAGARTIKQSPGSSAPDSADELPRAVTGELPLSPATDSALVQQNEEMRVRLIKLQAEHEQAARKLDDRLTGLAQERDEARLHLEKSHAENEHLLAELESTRQTLAAVQTEHGERLRDLEQARKELSALELERNKVLHELQQARQGLAKLETGRQDFESKAASLAIKLKNQARESRETIVGLLSKLEDLQAGQTAAQKREQQHQGTQEQMQDQLSQLSAQLESAEMARAKDKTSHHETQRKRLARERALLNQVEEIEQKLRVSRGAATAARKKAREASAQLQAATGTPAAKSTTAAAQKKGTADRTKLQKRVAEQQTTIAELKRDLQKEARGRKRDAIQHKTAAKEANAAARALKERIRKQEIQQETTDRWISDQRDLYKKQVAEWKARELELTAENHELQRQHRQALRSLEQALSMFAEKE